MNGGTLLSTPGVVGVYNSSLPCEDFRSSASPLLFQVWPEASFHHCCEDSTPHNFSLQNFTYGVRGARVISRPYFDLGIVDTFSPYWTQYHFWQVPQTRIVLEGLKCEYTDLAKLYSSRFWHRVVRGGALIAVGVIVILQIIVIVFVVFKWLCYLWCCCSRERGHRRPKERIVGDLKRWWWTKIKLEDWLSDLSHIATLSVVGAALIEAVGHSSPITWRPILFYNAAVVYAYLTLLSLVSSVLRQLAVSAFDESDDESKLREHLQVDLEKSYLSRNVPVPKARLDEFQLRSSHAFARISEDWRWQRVFGQLAVVVLVGTYLLFVDDETGTAMDSVAAIVFATMVVACMWSGGVGLVVAGRTLTHIWRHFRAKNLTEIPENDEDLHNVRMEESRILVSGSQRFRSTVSPTSSLGAIRE